MLTDDKRSGFAWNIPAAKEDRFLNKSSRYNHIYLRRNPKDKSWTNTAELVLYKVL